MWFECGGMALASHLALVIPSQIGYQIRWMPEGSPSWRRATEEGRERSRRAHDALQAARTGTSRAAEC